MVKKLILIVAIAFAALFNTRAVQAQEDIADDSAKIQSQAEQFPEAGINTQEYQLQRAAMKRVLERYDSQLVDQVDSFLASSYQYDLDPYLLVSISGLESYFARYMVQGSYNAYGWGGGWIYFKNWEDGINTISRALRENYYNKGAASVHDVGRIYAESPTWSVRVQNFMNQFYKEEKVLKESLTVLL
ncbi:MAG: hypothetical protein ACE5DQ_01845 [Candidatus Paceibacterota bacterium]